mmetsp:Transcript_58974/g.144638  ORF Transcript_58974/g.144638 Transcript_58974/m.144638 type:complete len:472 (+) Transcript_58974:103-1518(+)
MVSTRRKSSRSRGASPSPGASPRRKGSATDEINAFTSPLDFSEGHDKYSMFFYRPHFLIAMALGAVTLFFLAFYTTGSSKLENVKRGLLGMFAANLLFFSLPTPSPVPIFTRPHPVIWRVINGVACGYWLILIFLLFQSVDDARWLVTFVDPCHNGIQTCSDAAKIGEGQGRPKALPERSYADQCDVWTGGANCKYWADISKGEEPCFGNIQDAVHDEFFAAHIIGWWGKALILRHAGAAWLNSIAFEFIELSFEHWMPNFAECWWDHIILDVFVCNALGIFLAHVFIHYMECKEYRWMNISDYPTAKGKVKRLAEQFFPASWDSFKWDPLQSPRRLLVVLFVYFLILLQDFNAFALKYILWMPPRNPLNTYRLILWWLLGMMAVREFYEYATNKAVKRLGHHAWLGAMIQITEVLIWVKFGRQANEFTKPFPLSVIIGWFFAISGFIAWFVYHFHIVPAELMKKRGKKSY